jgi:hypothetical protein
LDFAAIAVYPVSFDLIILITLHQTIVYAVSAKNNLDSVAEALTFCPILPKPY